MKKTVISSSNLSPFFTTALQEVQVWLRISGYAATSIRGCSWTLKRLFSWMQEKGYTHLDKPILLEYLLFLEDKAWSENTYRITFYGIKKYLQYLFMIRRINIDVTLREYQHIYPSPIYLSLLQIQQLYAYMDSHPNKNRYRVLFAVLYAAGLRISEALALKLSDIDYQRKGLVVRRGKGGKRRFVPLVARPLYDIKTYILQSRPQPQAASAAYLLLSDYGHAKSSGMIYYHLKKLALANDIPPFGAHVLRHSIATHLLQSGMSIYQIKDFLGHKTLTSTQIYTHYE